MTPYLAKMTAAEYHADPCPTPSLSSSVAKTLIHQSPFHAWLKHPKLGRVRTESSPELSRGTLIHALVLGTGIDQIAVIETDNYRTKAAQEKRDAAISEGLTPILPREMDDARDVAASILDQIIAAGFAIHPQLSEQVAVWEESTEAGAILCRGMIDNFDHTQPVVLDLKTCRSAHPKACASHVLEYGYDIQHAAYTSAIEQIHPDLAGRVDYVWLFAEELPAGSPRRALVTVARPDGMMAELGRSKWKRACEAWAVCLRDNHWPAYEATRLEAPAWAMKELEEAT